MVLFTMSNWMQKRPRYAAWIGFASQIIDFVGKIVFKSAA